MEQNLKQSEKRGLPVNENGKRGNGTRYGKGKRGAQSIYGMR